jgi:hypothetical protein
VLEDLGQFPLHFGDFESAVKHKYPASKDRFTCNFGFPDTRLPGRPPSSHSDLARHRTARLRRTC